MSPRAALLFAAVTLVWGVPYLLIALAMDHGLTAPQVVAGRIAIGAAILLPVTWRSTWELVRRRPGRLSLLALVYVVLPFSLISWGETSIPSSMTGILIATEPFFVLALTRAVTGQHGLTRRAVAGTAVGFAGVVVMSGVAGGAQFAGALAVLGASVSYALGTLLVVHWFPGEKGLAVATSTLTLAVPPAVALALVSGVPVLTAPAAWSVVVLGVFCTALGFAFYFALIREVGAHGATLITYLSPVVAVAAGVAVRQEPVTWGTLVGAALIGLGAWVVLRRSASVVG